MVLSVLFVVNRLILFVGVGVLVVVVVSRFVVVTVGGGGGGGCVVFWRQLLTPALVTPNASLLCRLLLFYGATAVDVSLQAKPGRGGGRAGPLCGREKGPPSRGTEAVTYGMGHSGRQRPARFHLRYNIARR